MVIGSRVLCGLRTNGVLGVYHCLRGLCARRSGKTVLAVLEKDLSEQTLPVSEKLNFAIDFNLVPRRC